MSVLSSTDIFPEQLATDKIADQRHSTVYVLGQDITVLEHANVRTLQIGTGKKVPFSDKDPSYELLDVKYGGP
jgi:hypothetical protein